MNPNQTDKKKAEHAMDSVEQGKAALISSIEADALAEERRIVQEAETLAAERRKKTDQAAETLLREAREKAAEQAEALTKKILSGLNLELKRHSLRVQQAIIEEVMGRVERRFAERMGEDSYRTILVRWIVEGAMSLEAESATVNASAKERALLDERLLAQAQEVIRQRLGREMKLSLSNGAALRNQGVELISGDGRVAYNNQVKSRILRKQRAIQEMIHDALFAGGSNGTNSGTSPAGNR